MLIATAIAAGVLTAAATAVGGIVRLNQATAQRAELIAEARIIASRLHSGIDERDALDGFEGWRLTYEPYEEATPGRTTPPFDIVTASFGEKESFTFQTLISRADKAP